MRDMGFTVGLAVAVVCVTTVMVGCPQYSVYLARKRGEATVAEAKGVAEANRIISESADERLVRYMSAKGLASGRNLIYVPTEANIPIMEATQKEKAQ